VTCKPGMDGDGWGLIPSAPPLGKKLGHVRFGGTELGTFPFFIVIAIQLCQMGHDLSGQVRLRLPTLNLVIWVFHIAVVVEFLKRVQFASSQSKSGVSPRRATALGAVLGLFPGKSAESPLLPGKSLSQPTGRSVPTTPRLNKKATTASRRAQQCGARFSRR